MHEACYMSVDGIRLHYPDRTSHHHHHNCSFTQADGTRGGDEIYASPPSDLSQYLISLGELLVTWLSPQGVGTALSQRLLASGSSWALLRAFGRAIRPDLVRVVPNAFRLCCMCLYLCVCVFFFFICIVRANRCVCVCVCVCF